MGIPCASQPLIVDFKGGITVNYPIEFNQDTIKFLTNQTSFPINKLGIALNVKDVLLKVEEVLIKDLVPPIEIPVDCNPAGSISVSEVTVNQVSVEGTVPFVVSANLLVENTIDVPAGVNLSWPSASGTIYIDKTILAYTDNITDKYDLDIELDSLKLDSFKNEGDSNLYFFVVSGELVIQAIKK